MRIRFSDIELDTRRYILRRGRNRLRLRPKAFDLLIYLVDQRTRVVPRDELVEMLWGATIVGEGSLSGLVNELRKRLGERGDATSSIRTVHARGYQFVAEVVSEDSGQLDTMSPVVPDRDRRRTAQMGRTELLALFEAEGLGSPPVPLVERLLMHLGHGERASTASNCAQLDELLAEDGLNSTRRMRAVRSESSVARSKRGTG